MAPVFLDQGAYAVAGYTQCADSADVQVLRLTGAGHQWPNALWAKPGLGKVAQVNGNVLIRDFFARTRRLLKI